MKKQLSSLPSSCFEQMISSWLSMVKKNESGSVVGISKRSQLYRVNQFTRDEVLIEKYIHKQEDLLVLDLGAFALEKPEELLSFIEKKYNKDKRLLVFVLDADELIVRQYELLSTFDSIRHDLDISFVFFFRTNIFLPRLAQRLRKFSCIYQNSQIFSDYSYQDVQHHLEYLDQYFETTTPLSIKKKIAFQCGGRMWLIKQAMRYHTKTKDEKHLFDHEEMLWRLKYIYEEYEEEEKKVLQKIVMDSVDFSIDEIDIIKFLLQKRNIVNRDGRYHISIPLLHNYVMSLVSSKNKLAVNSEEKIVVNNIQVEGLFSSRERKVIRYFLKQNNSITRERLGEIIWKDGDYTDWALDMFINRLRNKFVKLGLSRNILQTKKNYGFIFKN